MLLPNTFVPIPVNSLRPLTAPAALKQPLGAVPILSAVFVSAAVLP